MDQLRSELGNQVRVWLHGRGLTDETIKAFNLGWNPQNWWPKREAWGLPEVLKENGRPKKLLVPEGLVIPKVTEDGIVRVRIRRPEGEPRYYLLPGSETGALCIPGGPAHVVLESELDAILLSQEAGDLATMIALGSASNRPDQVATDLLQKAETILIALDSDDAGAKQAWQWWAQHFPQSKRWLCIKGKDPSEARQNGLNLRNWIVAGLIGHQELQSAQPSGLTEEQVGAVQGKPPPMIQTETSEIEDGHSDDSPEWQSPFPQKCDWCTNSAVCQKPSRARFGLQLRHHCKHFFGKGST